MQIVHTVADVRRALASVRAQRIGLVPTMGYLHGGHTSLIRLCQQHADHIVVSVFVNPTQFGPGEDFAQYPRDFERDRRLIEAHGAHLLFAPSAEEMYPASAQIHFVAPELTRHLCGPKRPGHFEGVLLVVSKLFHIVQPAVSVFGQKDLQQLLLIKRLVKDLDFPIEIVAGPTVREPDGLAMSSRNSYLSPTERQQSTVLYRALQLAKALVQEGERRTSIVRGALTELISGMESARIDYVEIVEIERLQPVEVLAGRVAIALAVYIGRTRLIDNLVLEIDDGQVREIPALAG
jgi:pantoate--beta-alanine ligase